MQLKANEDKGCTDSECVVLHVAHAFPTVRSLSIPHTFSANLVGQARTVVGNPRMMCLGEHAQERRVSYGVALLQWAPELIVGFFLRPYDIVDDCGVATA